MWRSTVIDETATLKEQSGRDCRDTGPLRLPNAKPMFGCRIRRRRTSMVWVRFNALIPSKILLPSAHSRLAIKLTSILFTWVAVYKPRTTLSLTCQRSTVVTLNSPDVKVLIPFTFHIKRRENYLAFQCAACVVCVLKSFSRKVTSSSQMSWLRGQMLHVWQG